MTSKLIKLITVLAFLAAGCASSTTDAGVTTSAPITTQEPAPPTSPPSTAGTDPASPTTSTNTSSTVDNGSTANTGTLAISLEPIDGVFIEGFEIGLRIETAAGEVLLATLWSDYIESLGDTSINRYYDTVLIQEVPAGPILVLATVSIGAGPGPVAPDINGDLRCTLEVVVPPGGQVNVEVAFDARSNCLNQLT